MKEIFNLKGKIAIVTGGYGHLGAGMTKALHDFGATVYVAGRTESKFLDKFNNLSSDRIKFIEIDIMSSESINACFESVFKTEGSIDILINNAHSARGGNSQENMADEDFLYTLDGILGSVHRGIKSVLPYMKRQNSGKIVNIGSMYGLLSPNFDLYEGVDFEKYLNPPHYGAAKGGVNQITKYYAVHLAQYNIQVNSITPGPFPKPEIQENIEFVRRLKEKNPMKKIGFPEDLAGPLVLLSSDGSSFMTGQTVQVDGGWTIW